MAARLIAQGISGPLGQPVVVENRPPFITTETVAKAPPDGYSMLLNGSIVWVLPLLQKNVPWDPLRDFSPLTLVSSAPLTLVVHPSLPVKSVKELIALAKARPGKLDYSSAGQGVPPQIAAELFKSMAGVNIVSVNYKGSGEALTALIAGEVQVAFGNAAPVTPHITSGKLRALAVTSSEPSKLAPGLPTVAASGLPGYEYVSVIVMLAPAKTPEAIIRRLNQEIVRALNNPDVKQKFLDFGVESRSSSPEELAATVKTDMARMGKVIKDAGIKAE